MQNTNRKIGLFLIISGATFWGIGGTVAQKLFQDFAVEVSWLVTIRLLIAGVLLLTIQYISKDKKQIFDVWKNKTTAVQLIIYGLFGMLAVQYTYMAAIDLGNAAVATLLQYQSPIIIIAYLLFKQQMRLRQKDVITVLLSLSGCFLLLTNGSIAELAVPTPAIIWGLLSALALAFYTLYAARLLAYYDSLVIVGWAMIIGGVTLSFFHPPWQVDLSGFTIDGYLYLGFVIIFGTMLAFWFYIESLQTLSPKETSLLGSLEPMAAVLATVFWLKEPFGSMQWVGSGLILMMIILMAFGDKKTKQSQFSGD